MSAVRQSRTQTKLMKQNATDWRIIKIWNGRRREMMENFLGCLFRLTRESSKAFLSLNWLLFVLCHQKKVSKEFRSWKIYRQQFNIFTCWCLHSHQDYLFERYLIIYLLIGCKNLFKKPQKCSVEQFSAIPLRKWRFFFFLSYKSNLSGKI